MITSIKMTKDFYLLLLRKKAIRRFDLFTGIKNCEYLIVFSVYKNEFFK